jgi:hypothetical protein
MKVPEFSDAAGLCQASTTVPLGSIFPRVPEDDRRRTSLATVTNGEQLITGPQFGCAQHEARS